MLRWHDWLRSRCAARGCRSQSPDSSDRTRCYQRLANCTVLNCILLEPCTRFQDRVFQYFKPVSERGQSTSGDRNWRCPWWRLFYQLHDVQPCTKSDFDEWNTPGWSGDELIPYTKKVYIGWVFFLHIQTVVYFISKSHIYQLRSYISYLPITVYRARLTTRNMSMVARNLPTRTRRKSMVAVGLFKFLAELTAP